MTNNEPELIYLNGISGVTGTYSIPPVTLRDFAEVVQGREITGDHKTDVDTHRMLKDNSFGVQPKYGDGSDIRKTRWGMIFPAQAGPANVDAILQALDPLVRLREQQMGQPAEIYRAERGVKWVPSSKPGEARRVETKSEWLSRHGAGPGQVDPAKVPYYLLIVADPHSIPYIFQYELDVQYAVGRIYFQKIEEYARYATSVVEAASGRVKLARKAGFFGVANPGDRATALSYENLVKPLVKYVEEQSAGEGGLRWETHLAEGQNASKSTLKSLLGGKESPAILFTASHGIDFPYMHPDQYRYQGAILCRDWGGPNSNEPAGRKHFLAAEDIPDDHNLLGSVVFHFACFGAGTPYWDEHAAPRNRNRKALAGRPFMAALPNRLLSLPGGGALAIIGHIDRAWNYSFQWPGLPEQTGTYESILYQLMSGKPAGLAMESMNDRYSEIATILTNTMEDLRHPPFTDALLARAAFEFACNNDSRGYAIIGDPAVTIPAAPIDEPALERPSIQLNAPAAGVVPVVFNPDSLAGMTWVELAAVEKENQALGIAPAQGAPQGSTPPGQAAPEGLTGDGLPRPPVLNTTVLGQPPGDGAQAQKQVTPAPAPAGRSFSTPVDGLAFALQLYTSPEEISFSVGVEGVNYSLLDDAKERIKQIVVSLNTALSNLTKKMEEVTGELATLEVLTNVVDDLDTFDPTTAEKRILTRIAADGDIQVFIPRGGERLDEDLLALHQDMVRQALSNRLEVARALAEMIAGLFGGNKA